MINLNINGKELHGFTGQTILETARVHGIEIPTLCHDDRIKTYGACGLCVVEVEGSSRLLRACATEIAPGMIIKTESERVQASRKVTLELMLSDHIGDCRPPCVKACPANTDCQGYVGLIANGEYREALKVIKEQLPLPASIGMVCPHPCETACRRQLVEEPIAIAALKVFAAEQDLSSGSIFAAPIKEASGKRIAIIGSGPAGLTAAYFLARDGHQVTIYEAMPEPGGMLRYGIPEYRLPKHILDQEIDIIRAMGVKFIVNTRVNTDVSLEYLRSQNDAVFIGIGAWKYSRIGCPGEDVPGVIGGIDFLRAAALNEQSEIGSKVAVIGGGNTAMDAARTAVRLGAAKVMVLYRRTRDEMPAEDIEIREAEEEGVEFRFLLAPEEIVAEAGKVSAIRMQKMQLGDPDASGRRKPVPVEGAVELIEVDTIIAAIGQQVELNGFGELGVSKWRTIDVDDDSLMTNLPGVFAGGDAVTGPGIAIEAVAQGKRAAEAIGCYVNNVLPPEGKPFLVERNDLSGDDFADVTVMERVVIPVMEPGERRGNFNEIAGRMTEAEALREASRCLECGCRDYFECRLIQYANQYQAQPAYLEGEKHQSLVKDIHPFIERDAAKCILCGLCVRICDELMGVNALGLVQRGFDTVVKPEFGMALQETACINCGQCVAVCPTGALLERYPQIKNVPVVGEKNSSVCSYCDLGCGQMVHSCGNSIMRVLPDDNDMLCSKGRFAFKAFTRDRLKMPLIRKEGELQECSWKEALLYIAKKTLSLRNRYGNSTSAIFAAPSLTIEEAGLASYLGKSVLGSEKLSSFTRNAGWGLQQVFGDNLSTNSLEELEATDMILMVGTFNSNQIMAARVRKAVGQGARLCIISPEPSLVDDLAALKITAENNTGFITEILASLLLQGIINTDYIESRTLGWPEVEKSLRTLQPGEDARKIAEMYGKAGKAMILVDGHGVTSKGVVLLADLALMTGRIGSARNGIIVINPGGNASGIWQAGFTADCDQIIASMANNETRAAFILGEDPLGGGAVKDEVLSGMELLVVLSPFMTPTAGIADVVLPASVTAEGSGTYLRADGKKVVLHKSTPAPAGCDNLEILQALTDIIQPRSGAACETPDKARPATTREETLVKYTNTFGFSDGRARLIMPEPERLFVPALITDPTLLRSNV